MTVTLPSNIVIGKRKGNRVRYFNTNTAKWGGWTTVENTDSLLSSLSAPTVAAESPAQRVSVPAASVTVDASMGIDSSLDEMTRDELRALAKARGMRGYSRMTKAELSAALIEQN